MNQCIVFFNEEEQKTLVCNHIPETLQNFIMGSEYLLNILGAKVLLMSFFSSVLFTPVLIWLAKKYQLVDKPNERKVHTTAIPTLGGIAIVGSLLLSFLGVLYGFHMFELNLFFALVALLTFIGVVDDMLDISAKFRLLVQLGIGFVLCWYGFRIESLFGFLGIYELSLPFQYGVTILFVSLFINAFNFIDGINGLAGGIGLINALYFALLFYLLGNGAFTLLALALAGAIGGFLVFNVNNAKIFMGDTGSTVIGLSLSVMAIKLFMVSSTGVEAAISNMHILVLGICLVPIFDIIRTVLLRLKNKKSPFHADKTHIHHLLLKTKLNHLEASLILYIANLVLIFVALGIKDVLTTNKAILLLMLACIFMMEFLSFRKIKLKNVTLKKSKQEAIKLKKQNQFVGRNVPTW